MKIKTLTVTIDCESKAGRDYVNQNWITCKDRAGIFRAFELLESLRGVQQVTIDTEWADGLVDYRAHSVLSDSESGGKEILRLSYYEWAHDG